MPGKLMQYSGLITKTRAMSGKLLTREEMNRLAECATVNEVIQYLKGTKSYGDAFQGTDRVWHRGQAEIVIENSLYREFEKLYQFADARQRLAFQYLFFRYEVDFIKKCLKYVFQEKQEERDIYVDDFFYKHMGFSVDGLRKAVSLTEFETILSGTRYSGMFMQLHNDARAGYAEYAMRLDTYYYTTVYKDIRRMKHCELKKVLMEIYGTQIDWLNIMWIYRSKRFYNQTPSEIFASIIPVAHKLKNEELQRLTSSSDLAELKHILENSAYFKGKDAFVQMEDEISYKKVIRTMYQRVSRKFSVSMAPVLKYIYEKEQEMEHVTTIIEGVRYQVSPKEIKDLILITV